MQMGVKSQTQCRRIYEQIRSKIITKGYAQTYGIDYEETYSLVAKMTTIRTIIVMAIVKGWSLHQMDVKNVFLHGDLQEEVYMEQPPSYVDQTHPNLVCRLNYFFVWLEAST
jgi:hypothetical protein